MKIGLFNFFYKKYFNLLFILLLDYFKSIVLLDYFKFLGKPKLVCKAIIMSNTQNKNKFIRLLEYSGNYKYLTIFGCILSALSAICLLIPFIYIWDVVNALLAVAPDFSHVPNVEGYAFNAFFYAFAGIALNFLVFYALICRHLKMRKI